LSSLYFDGFLLSSCVLDGQGSDKLVGFILGDLQLFVFFLELFFHLTNSNTCFE
jgi:hypothetical protein